MKVCSKCKVNKPKSEYYKRNNRPCGVKNICKECNKVYPSRRNAATARASDLMKSYKITTEEYNMLLEAQNNMCAICSKNASELSNNRKKYLCVDHCHVSGKVRGLLCDTCNRALGMFKDSVAILENAIAYIDKQN